MKALFSFSVILATASAFAAPVISDISMEQSGNRKVTISYTLSDEPAIITVDIQTNAGASAWASIGGENLNRMIGRVNEVVQPSATPRKVLWYPHRDWAESIDAIPAGDIRAVVTAWATNAPPDYLVINLADRNESIKYYLGEEYIPGGIHSDLYLTNSLVMRKIPAANIKWRMGGNTANKQVVLTEDYYMAVFEMTEGQCSAAGVLGNWNTGFAIWNSAMRPLIWKKYVTLRGDSTDMDNVGSSSDIALLRQKYGIAFDIPTEAQWEFACRGGTIGDNYQGTSSDLNVNVNKLGRYTANSGHDGGSGNTVTLAAAKSFDQFTARPGSYPANPFGLYDMFGNTAEWCRDYYNANTFTEASGVQVDPVEADSAKATIKESVCCRVVKGGSWNSWGSGLKASGRVSAPQSTTSEIYTSNPFGIGYRLVCPPPGR